MSLAVVSRILDQLAATAVGKARRAHKGRTMFTTRETIEATDGTRIDDGAEMLITSEADGVCRRCRIEY